MAGMAKPASSFNTVVRPLPDRALHVRASRYLKYRLRADDTGFRNLTVAGDWIDSRFHVACMEGAVMGGISAARAVSGLPIPIIGEDLGRARH